MFQPFLRTLSFSRAILTPKSCARPYTTTTYRIRLQLACSFNISQSRTFRLSIHKYKDEGPSPVAETPIQTGSEDQVSNLEASIAQEREKRTRAPWHREGSDLPPVARRRSAGAMTKGMGFYSISSWLDLIPHQANCSRLHPGC